MKISTKVILIYSIIASLLLYITENIFHPTYIIQMLQKIISFIVIPILLAKHFSESFGKFGHIQKSSVIYGVSFGLLGAFIIGLTYYFLKDSIEWGAIKESIASRGVNSTTFIFIFTYIMFGNSLVEEFFFRGVVFDSLLKYSKIFAYILSSLLFSLYHFAIFGAWFHGYILVLAFFGLFAGGLFFAWLYQKTKGIWGAYIFHILADLIILIIGYIQLFS